MSLTAAIPLDFMSGFVPSSARVPLRIEQIDPASDQDWDEQVSTHPRASVFHGSAWSAVLSEVYGHRALYLRAWNEGRLVALLPLMEVRSAITGRRGVSLPFSDYCDPLLFDHSAAAELVEQLYRIARANRWKFFELRGAGLTGLSTPVSKTYFAHRLSLTPALETIFAGFDASNQRAIRKAERSELAVEFSNDLASVIELFDLHAQTRRRHGVPPQPRSFFEAIHRHLVAPGLGFTTIVRKDDRPIAAALYFQQGARAVYKFGASDVRYQEHRPNNFAMWHGIQELIRRGAEELHFGRSDVGQEGLRRFKLSWGAEESALNYYRFDLRQAGWTGESSSTVPSSANHLFRLLPLAVNRAAGALIYPHLD